MRDLFSQFLTAVNNEELNIAQQYVSAYDIDVTRHDNQALINAVCNRDYAMVKFLVENGADVDARNGEPLYIAYKNSDLHTFEYLIESGASDANLEEDFGRDYLYWFRVDSPIAAYCYSKSDSYDSLGVL